ncbi:MAG TPA: aminoacyl--tRNA ligase-related protein, partial [Patescibacteria group bacterium]
MKQSRLFGKTSKTVSKDEVSANAQLLFKAGFVNKLMAGVYSYLPLGWRVHQRVASIVREEMNKISAQEVFLPALHPRENWEQTKRWDSFDVLFKIESQTGNSYVLGPTHEEVIVPLVKKYVQSYKDLPVCLYQIQTKFRDEKRAKSGLLRGREFSMKDLYSFHATQEDLETYYQRVVESYKQIFSRCGLEALLTEASGGAFTEKFSHEFQVLTPYGEDTIIFCPSCHWAQNKEIARQKAGDKCSRCQGALESSRAIEAGNIFDLGTKFSKDFNLTYADEQGREHLVIIGCYGLGISRLLGAIAEVFHDDRGLIWPQNI